MPRRWGTSAQRRPYASLSWLSPQSQALLSLARRSETVANPRRLDGGTLSPGELLPHSPKILNSPPTRLAARAREGASLAGLTTAQLLSSHL
jgi:hypothetical protein